MTISSDRPAPRPFPHRDADTRCRTGGRRRVVGSLLLTISLWGVIALAPAAEALTPPAEGSAQTPETGDRAPREEADTPPDQSGSGEAPTRIEEFDTLATEVRITLIGGGTVTGILLESDASSVSVETLGIPTRFDRSQILTMSELPPVLERYRARRAELMNPDEDSVRPIDSESLLNLAIWLRDRGAYVTALSEVELALSADPYNRPAAQLRRWLVHHIDLLKRRAERKAEGGDEGAEASRPRATPAEGRARPEDNGFPLLTPEEVNLMRVFEMDLRNPPRFVLTRDSIERFIESYQGHRLMPATEEGRQALLYARETRVIDLMFRAQAREFYPEIRVREHPRSVELFQNNVHRTWVTPRTTATAGRTRAGSGSGTSG